ncbi:thioredoxin fold domain-containing protein [Ostreibacterium oceani]|nr:thioredoxin fold domain-containing protein [Ostreibacterium oceani]
MKKQLIALSALLLVGLAHSEEKPNLDLLNSSLNPSAEIKSVTQSAIPGIYEVQINNQIVYLSEDGEKVITGDIYDLKQKFSHTEKTKNALRQQTVASIDDSDKIIYQAKEEKYRITVFTDITCPYCTQLHEQIAEFNDQGITVKYMAFPRAGAGSQAQKDMQKIWCADDKAQAMNEAKKNKQIPDATCDGNQVIEQFLLGQDIGINATPTTIFEDGELQPGFVPAEDMRKILDEKALSAK